MNLRINNKDVPLPSPYPVIPRQPRQKPMQILALGLSRTGTLSLWAALNQLGYSTYHGFEACFDNANGSLDFWNSAIQAEITNRPQDVPRTSDDFDEVLWRYDALTDTPCVLFSEELLTAYPDAKVILTERDVDSWVTSMQNSYYRVLNSTGMQLLRRLDTGFLGKYYAMGMGSLNTWTNGDAQNISKLKEGYVAHYEKMRAVVPKERLLEWHPRHGWEPLCEFLGREVPEGEFPKVNQGDFVANLHEKMLIYRFLVVCAKGFRNVSPLIVSGVAWWWWFRS